MTTAILVILALLMAALVTAGARPRPAAEDRLPFSRKPPAVGFQVHVRNRGHHIHAACLERGVPELCFVCEPSFEGNVLGSIAPDSPEWPGFVSRDPASAHSIFARVAEALGSHLTSDPGWVIEAGAGPGYALIKLTAQSDDDQG